MSPETATKAKEFDEKESEKEDKETVVVEWKSQADGARTDLAAANAQVTSLGAVLNQEHRFKLQVETSCKEKTEKHVIENVGRFIKHHSTHNCERTFEETGEKGCKEKWEFKVVL